MAQLAFGVAGAAVGSFFGAPALGFSIGSALGGYVTRPGIEDQEGPRLTDLSVQASSYGAPIPEIWGGMRKAGQLIWSTGLIETRHEEDIDGKGGDSATSTTYSYAASFAIAICKGEIGGIRKIWADGKLIYSADGDAVAAAEAGTGFYTTEWNYTLGTMLDASETAQSMTVYPGSETQLVDTLMESYEGVGNVPAYRGTAYIVFDTLPLARFGNRIPNLTFEVIKTETTSFRAGYTLFSETGYYLYHNNDGILSWYNTAAALNSATKSADGFVFSGEKYTTDMIGNITNYQAVHNVISSSCATSTVNLRDWGLVSNTQDFNVLGISACAFPGGGYQLMIGQRREFDLTSVGYGDVYAATEGLYLTVDNVTLTNYAVVRTDFRDGRIYMQLVNAGGGLTPAGLAGAIVAYDAPYYGDAAAVTTSTSYTSWYVHPYDGVYALSTSGADQILTQLDYELTVLDTWTISGFGQSDGLLVSGKYVIIAWYDAGNTQSNWRVYEFDGTGTLALHQTTTTEAVAETVESINGAVPISNILFAHGPWLTPLLSLTGHNLGSIVSDLCLDAGLVAGDIDVTALTDTVTGYCRTGQMTVRNAIEPLQNAYFFDCVESDYKLKFIKRGGASVATLTEDELGAVTEGDAPQVPFPIAHQQEMELPLQVHVAHIDPVADHQPNVQRSIRQATESNLHTRINLPIVMDVDKARQVAEILHYDAWTQRNRQRLSTLIKYAYLDPGDVITVTRDSGNHTLRIESQEITNLVKLETVDSAAAIYTNSAVGADSGIDPAIIQLSGPTDAVLLDTGPLSNLSHTSPVYYLAMRGYNPTWPGGILFRSVDGVEWAQITSRVTSAVIGQATDALAADQWTTWDNNNTVNVIVSGALESRTEDAVLAGANWAALGVNGRWEIIAFVNATLETDGSYTLSKLLRGRAGTEAHISGHLTADRFILLSLSTIGQIEYPPADIGSLYNYLGVTIGKPISSASPFEFTSNANNLKPFCPVHIRGSRDGSNNLTIQWNRRSRYTPQMLWAPIVGEDTQSYEIDIVGASPARTITSSNEVHVYTAANQTTDGFTPGDPITVQIYQISAAVGRGYVAEETI